MKKTLIILCLLFGSFSYGYSLQETFDRINSSSCVEASSIAMERGYLTGLTFGSSMLSDAAQVCDNEAGRLSEADEELKSVLSKACGNIEDCPGHGDTLGAPELTCPQEVSACLLSVSKFFYHKQNK